MKASMAWSCYSLSRKLRRLKEAFGARRFSARSWRRSKRDASQPSTKARGRPSKIQAKSNSMDHGQLRRAAGSRCRCDNGALRAAGGAAVAPPAPHPTPYPHPPPPAERPPPPTSPSGARHWVQKKKCTVASCWLFSEKGKSEKKMAALSSHRRYFIGRPSLVCPVQGRF